MCPLISYVLLQFFLLKGENREDICALDLVEQSRADALVNCSLQQTFLTVESLRSVTSSDSASV